MSKNLTYTQGMDIIIMKRLLVYLSDIKDPWNCKFNLNLLDNTDGQEKEESKYFTKPKNKYWHARRINYIISSSSDLFYPITIDSSCSCKHPEQIFCPYLFKLCDGWHRFFAHIYLGYKKINTFYSGRVDVLNYLKGK